MRWDRLQQDDKVDALIEDQVRDVYARGKLARLLVRTFRVWHDQEEHWRGLLEDGTDHDLYVVVREGAGEHHDLLSVVRPHTEAYYNARALFGRVTVNPSKIDADATLTEIAREKIKRNLRQSGMPEFMVCRGRVNYQVYPARPRSRRDDQRYLYRS